MVLQFVTKGDMMFEDLYYRKGSLYYRDTDKEIKWHVSNNGYARFRYRGKLYLRGRVIFFLFAKRFPEVVDHHDGNRLNDNIANLREATKQQNNCNVKLRKDNKSGHKGVCWKKKLNKWQVLVQVNKKNYYFGVFSDLEEAIQVASLARQHLHKEFARDA